MLKFFQIICIGLFFFVEGALAKTLAQEVFIIPPYVLKKDNGEYILKFKTRQALNLAIDLQWQLGERTLELKRIEDTYLPQKLHSVNLGQVNCREKLNYSLGNLMAGQIKSPPCQAGQEEWSFAVISDTQHGSLNDHVNMAKVIVKNLNENLRFLLITGDLVQAGGIAQLWETFFTEGWDYLTRIPLMAAVGNHEYYFEKETAPRPLNFHQYFRWPGEEETKESGENLAQLSYSFPQVNLLLLNSNYAFQTLENQQKSLAWLKQSLELAQQEEKKVIVAFHHSPFTSGYNNGGKEAKFLRQQVVPLLENAGNVILVLTGHEHMFERSFKKGLHYLSAGPSGGTKSVPLSHNPYGKVLRPGVNSLSLITMQKDKVVVQSKDSKDQVLDQFTIPL